MEKKPILKIMFQESNKEISCCCKVGKNGLFSVIPMCYTIKNKVTGGNTVADQEYKKSRPLYIANYIRVKSDSNTWVTQKQIMDYLYEEFEIMPDRKTIRRDIAMLRDEMGMDIEEKAYKGYRLVSSEFELDDLKILQSAYMPQNSYLRNGLKI